MYQMPLFDIYNYTVARAMWSTNQLSEYPL